MPPSHSPHVFKHNGIILSSQTQIVHSHLGFIMKLGVGQKVNLTKIMIRSFVSFFPSHTSLCVNILAMLHCLFFAKTRGKRGSQMCYPHKYFEVVLTSYLGCNISTWQGMYPPKSGFFPNFFWPSSKYG